MFFAQNNLIYCIINNAIKKVSKTVVSETPFVVIIVFLRSWKNP
jgi:hypothetical protein